MGFRVFVSFENWGLLILAFQVLNLYNDLPVLEGGRPGRDPGRHRRDRAGTDVTGDVVGHDMGPTSHQIAPLRGADHVRAV